MAIGDQELKVVHTGYEAFANGDMDTIRGNSTDDLVWRVPGTNPLSGDKKGIDATLAYFAQLFEVTGGTLKVDLQDIAVGEKHVIAKQRNSMERNGKKMAFDAVLVFTFRDGKICECSEFENDQHALDAFLA
jgi:uncharacterized protein